MTAPVSTGSTSRFSTLWQYTVNAQAASGICITVTALYTSSIHR